MGWSRDEMLRVEARAIDSGVARRNGDGDLVPAYRVTERDIRAAYEEAGGAAREREP